MIALPFEEDQRNVRSVPQTEYLRHIVEYLHGEHSIGIGNISTELVFAIFYLNTI